MHWLYIVVSILYVSHVPLGACTYCLKKLNVVCEEKKTNNNESQCKILGNDTETGLIVERNESGRYYYTCPLKKMRPTENHLIEVFFVEQVFPSGCENNTVISPYGVACAVTKGISIVNYTRTARLFNENDIFEVEDTYPHIEIYFKQPLIIRNISIKMIDNGLCQRFQDVDFFIGTPVNNILCGTFTTVDFPCNSTIVSVNCRNSTVSNYIMMNKTKTHDGCLYCRCDRDNCLNLQRIYINRPFNKVSTTYESHQTDSKS